MMHVNKETCRNTNKKTHKHAQMLTTFGMFFSTILRFVNVFLCFVFPYNKTQINLLLTKQMRIFGIIRKKQKYRI